MSITITKEDKLVSLLPQATPRALEYLALKKYNLDNLEGKISSLKKQLDLKDTFYADNILIDVLLGLTSKKAAKRKIEVLKSREFLFDFCQDLALDEGTLKLLCKVYASPLSKTLFIEACDKLNPDFELKKDSAAISDIIDSLLEEAKKQELSFSATEEKEKLFLKDLLRNNLIDKASYEDLENLFFNQTSVSLTTEWQNLFDRLKQIYDKKQLNAQICASALKGNILPSEAEDIMNLAKTLNLPVLAEDLQSLYLKYGGIKTNQEIAKTLHALLKNFDYLYLPQENLSLALQVMLEATQEKLDQAQTASSYNKGKILFLRALCANKLFAPFAIELTRRFYGKVAVQDLSLLLQNITARFAGGSCKENAQIGLKVLLGKLTFKEASLQANFLFDKRKAQASDSLEQEALNSYLGTKTREEVLGFIHNTLGQYDFWQNDRSKYCFALSVLIEQLNGTLSEEWALCSLKLLQENTPETTVEAILKELKTQNISSFEIINSYRDFYAQTSSHKEAGLRVINKFN